MRRALIMLAQAALGCSGMASADPTDASQASDASIGDDSDVLGDGPSSDDSGFRYESAVPDGGNTFLVCPASAPMLGSACDDRMNLCEYGSSNNVLCNTLYSCSQHRWSLAQDTTRCPVLQSCPADIDAGSCTAIHTRCEYPDAGRDCVCSSCGGGPPGPNGGQPTWRCFDPGPGCPFARPNIGTPCSIPDGGACAYSPGACCTGVWLACREGIWAGGTTEECP